MEGELQELRDLVAQLRAEKEQLQQQQAAATPGPSGEPTTPAGPPPALSTPSAPITERLVLVPRDRRCPAFRGRSGLGLEEWIEEAQACMRARHLSPADQAFFLFDHLEGEPREEIKYRPSAVKNDPVEIVAVLRELYGCSDSYVALQEAFFSRRQQEGETLQEFSLALMSLMASVKQQAPTSMLNADVLLREQFIEHVIDGSLRRELKQFVRREPAASLFAVRAEALRWEREGLPGGARGRSYSVPSVLGLQYGVQSSPLVTNPSQASELLEVKEMLKLQQEQLNRLTDTLAQLHTSPQHSPTPEHSPVHSPIICRQCHQPGHSTRQCEARRNLPHPRSAAPASFQPARRRNPAQQPEN